MLALGLQGSPRKKGNSDLLLGAFMDALDKLGVRTHTIDVVRSDIEPCKELTVCEKKGLCPIDDEMGRHIYTLIRQADIIVAASPIFFYNVSAQLKALIDRCQALWARKYMLKLRDPGHGVRQGFLLSVGATSGKQLFDGVHLTAKYFFDAVDARYAGSLTYRGVEGRGEITRHASMVQDVEKAAATLAGQLPRRRKVLFAGRKNAACSQMAAAFARLYAGTQLDVASAGEEPADQIDPLTVAAMQEKGIDVAFQKPQPMSMVIEALAPDEIVAMGADDLSPMAPHARHRQWELPDVKAGDMAAFRAARDTVEQHVKAYIDKL